MIKCPVFDKYYMCTMFTITHYAAGCNVHLYGVIVLGNLHSSYGIHFTSDYQNIDLFIHPFPVPTACILYCIVLTCHIIE
jgi:hypothetical protein